MALGLVKLTVNGVRTNRTVNLSVGDVVYVNPRKVKNLAVKTGGGTNFYFQERNVGRFWPPIGYSCATAIATVVANLNAANAIDLGWRTLTLIDTNGDSSVKSLAVDDIAYIKQLSTNLVEIMYISGGFKAERYTCALKDAEVAAVFDDGYNEDGTPYVHVP